MQMAMVAAAVANGGKLMTPHFATKVVNQDGQHGQDDQAEVYSQVMKPSTAAEVDADDEEGRRGGHRHRRAAGRASVSPARPAPPGRRRPART